MSDRPTPETDALASEHRGAVIWPDFARKLERERDQFQQIALDAERELQRMEQLVVVKRSNNRSIDARNKRLERERDDLKDQLATAMMSIRLQQRRAQQTNEQP